MPLCNPLRAACALALSTACLPAAAADFPSIGSLAQTEFRALSEDLGAVLAYRGITPATPLGVLGFDVGIGVTDTTLENSSAFRLAGATGNICTEDMVNMLEDMGYDTRVDLAKLLAVARRIPVVVGHDTPGQVMKAGQTLELHDPPESLRT